MIGASPTEIGKGDGDFRGEKIVKRLGDTLPKTTDQGDFQMLNLFACEAKFALKLRLGANIKSFKFYKVK